MEFWSLGMLDLWSFWSLQMPNLWGFSSLIMWHIFQLFGLKFENRFKTENLDYYSLTIFEVFGYWIFVIFEAIRDCNMWSLKFSSLLLRIFVVTILFVDGQLVAKIVDILFPFNGGPSCWSLFISKTREFCFLKVFLIFLENLRI